MCADGATRAEVADASLPSINEKATPNSLGVAMTGARGRNRTGTPFGEGFSYHFDFSRHTADTECLWSGARLHHSLVALGARRLLSTPSQTLGLGSALARLQQQSGRSPNLTGFTSGVSPRRLKLFKSLVSTDFTTRAVCLLHSKAIVFTADVRASTRVEKPTFLSEIASSLRRRLAYAMHKLPMQQH